jgi:asparagine synthase (glutamine-hydrolysing)
MDAMSMGISLEVRSPFVDRTVVEAASHIHAEERCASVPNKKFEYDVFSGVLRGRVPFQRKHGFVLPFQAILREPAMARRIDEMLTDAKSALSVGLQPEFVRQIHHRYYHGGRMPWSRLWALTVILSWTGMHRVTL